MLSCMNSSVVFARKHPSGPGSSVSPCAFDNDGWLLGSYLPGALCMR